MTESKTECAVWYVLLMVFIIGFFAATVMYHREKDKRIALEKKAQNYDVLHPLIEGSDSEILKNVLKVLEKNK